jgi:hypothetical protein
MYFLCIVVACGLFLNASYILLRQCFKKLTSYYKNSLKEAIEKEEEEEVVVDKPIKALKRTTTMRHRVCAYMQYLESGKGSRIEQSLWKSYSNWVPIHYREINSELGIVDALPRWLESSIDFCGNPYIRQLALFGFIFMSLIFTSHLWMPTVMVGTIEQELEHVLALDIHSCLNATMSSYCFLTPDDTIEDAAILQNLSYHSLHLSNHSSTPVHLIIDQARRVRFGFDFINGTKPTRKYIHLEEHYLPLLANLQQQHEEGGTSVCICPIFLNLVGPFHFFFDSTQWHILYEPTIYRNSSLANLVASRLRYKEKTLMYERNKKVRAHLLNMSDELIHFDTFVVEYTDLLSHGVRLQEEEEEEDETISSLTMLNQKVSAYYVIERATATPVTIFEKSATELERKRVSLTGNDAVCFIYCDNIKRGLENLNMY